MTKKKNKQRSLGSHVAEKLIDIALIIISIYIALAAEGWAEKRHEHKKLMHYYTSFINEVKMDIEDLKEEEADAKRHIKYCELQKRFLLNNAPADSILKYFGKMFNSTLFGASNMISYQSMLASGDMKLVEDLGMRQALIKLDGEYKGIKFHDDLYTTYIIKDLTNFLTANFNLLTSKPINPNFYKQVEYNNLVILFQSRNESRLENYKEAITAANELLKALEKEVRK